MSYIEFSGGDLTSSELAEIMLYSRILTQTKLHSRCIVPGYHNNNYHFDHNQTPNILVVSIQCLSACCFRHGPQISMPTLSAGSHIQSACEHYTFSSVLGYQLVVSSHPKKN